VSVLDRKLLRELWSAAGMLISTTFIIAIGVACYVGMGSTHRNLSEAKRRYYQQCRMADFSLELKKAPLAEIQRLASLPGVAEIRPRIQFYTTVDLPEEPEPLNGLVLSLPDRRQPTIDDIVVRSGSYFTDRRRDEVIVNEAFARRHGLRPGDWIGLVLNNRRQELFIVGTAISCEFIYLVGPGSFVPDREHFGVFYLKRSYAEEVLDFSGAANQVLGRMIPSRRGHAREVLRRAEAMLAPYGVSATTPLDEQLSNRYISQEIEQLKTFAFIMPAIFLAVVALVLNVLLTRLVEQQRTVTGTLKALGYSDGYLFWHFLKFGMAVGVTGGLLGCVAGYQLADMMTRMYRVFYEFPELSTHVYLDVDAFGVAVSVLFALLGSLRGSWAALRLHPAEAMRQKPPARGGAVFLERAAWLWRRLSSGWRMVLRNLVRHRLRTAAGVFAAAMGAAVLVNTFMMADGLERIVAFQFQWTLRSDLDLTLKDEHGYDALLEAGRLPGVRRAEPILEVACIFRHENVEKKGGITGITPDAQLTVPRTRDGRALRVPSAGLLMSRTLAELLRVAPGDSLEVQPIKGLRRRVRVPVVEVADSYLGTVVYADIHYLNRLVGEEFDLNRIQLALDRDPQAYAAVYRRLKQLSSLEAVNARADMIRNLEDTVLGAFWVFLGLLILFAGMLFFGSVLNASLVSMAERQREIATLRAMGYGPWQVGSLLLRESLIVTLAGTALGIPLGYLLTVYSAPTHATEMFRIPIIINAGTCVRAMAAGLLFASLAHAVVQWAIHRMNWLDALNVKE